MDTAADRAALAPRDDDAGTRRLDRRAMVGRLLRRAVVAISLTVVFAQAAMFAIGWIVWRLDPARSRLARLSGRLLSSAVDGHSVCAVRARRAIPSRTSRLHPPAERASAHRPIRGPAAAARLHPVRRYPDRDLHLPAARD